MVPWLQARMAMWAEEKAIKKANEEAGELDKEIAPMTQAEFESKLVVYPSPFEDYNEMVLQLGFVSFFGVAFPLCALMALVNNMVEIRSDAFKVLKAHQRPEPRQAEDIGSWYTVMHFMCFISIATNCALVCFVASVSNDWTKDAKVWIFVVSEHIVIFFKVFLAEYIDDVPPDIQQEMEKEEYRRKRAAEELALAERQAELESGVGREGPRQSFNDLDNADCYAFYDEADPQWMKE